MKRYFFALLGGLVVSLITGCSTSPFEGADPLDIAADNSGLPIVTVNED